MIYLGTFDNIKNKEISVTIGTNGDKALDEAANAYQEYIVSYDDAEWELNYGGTKLIMSGNPVEISLNGDTDDLFNPFSPTSATIRILAESIIWDLYSSKFDVDVLIRNETDNKLLFYGFLTPNVYSSEFDTKYNEIELEAISPLSTTKYYNIDTDIDKIVTVANAIRYCINKVGYYTKFYWQKGLKVYFSQYIQHDDFLDYLYLYSENFKDNNEGWDAETLLSEICRIFGVTCLEWNNNLYFIDYNLFSKDDASFEFYEYSVQTNTKTLTSITPNFIVLDNPKKLGGSTSISLDESYTQIQVLANTNPYDEKERKFDDDSTIYTFSETEFNDWLDSISTLVPEETITIDTNSNYKAGEIKLTQSIRGNKSLQKNNVTLAFYDSPNIKRYFWQGDSNGSVTRTNDRMIYNEDEHVYTIYPQLNGVSVSKPSNWDSLTNLYKCGRHTATDRYTRVSNDVIGGFMVKYLVNPTVPTGEKNTKPQTSLVLPSYSTSFLNFDVTNIADLTNTTNLNNTTDLARCYVYQPIIEYSVPFTYPRDITNDKEVYLRLNFNAVYSCIATDVLDEWAINKPQQDIPFPAVDIDQYFMPKNPPKGIRFLNLQISIGDWYLVGTKSKMYGDFTGEDGHTHSVDLRGVAVCGGTDTDPDMDSVHTYPFAFTEIGVYNYMWVYLPKTTTNLPVDTNGISYYDLYVYWNNAIPHLRAFYQSATNYAFDELKLSSNIKTDWGLSSTSGIAFKVNPINQNELSSMLGDSINPETKVSVRFMRPHPIKTEECQTMVFINDLEFHTEIAEVDTVLDTNEDDTLYKNIDEESFVNKMDALECKINSQDTTKKVSLSSVLYGYSSVKFWLKEIWHSCVNAYTSLENILIKKRFEHYKSPKVKLNTTVDGEVSPIDKIELPYLNKKLLVVNSNFQVREDTTEIDTIEY